MLGRSRAKTVAGELIPARQKSKIRMGHDQVEKPGPGAHRAVARQQPDSTRDVRLEPDRTAMAAALYRDPGLASLVHIAHPNGSTTMRALMSSGQGTALAFTRSMQTSVADARIRTSSPQRMT